MLSMAMAQTTPGRGSSRNASQQLLQIFLEVDMIQVLRAIQLFVDQGHGFDRLRLSSSTYELWVGNTLGLEIQ